MSSYRPAVTDGYFVVGKLPDLGHPFAIQSIQNFGKEDAPRTEMSGDRFVLLTCTDRESREKVQIKIEIDQIKKIMNRSGKQVKNQIESGRLDSELGYAIMYKGGFDKEVTSIAPERLMYGTSGSNNN